ncbi:MAG: acetylglutamate kinase, partial [Petrimonas sp.]|nr:acetylglutamate kinase [Petrimonas sp.]
IPLMNQEAFAKLKLQGVVANGMIPKLDNSFKAINQGVSEVVILHAKNLLKKTGTRLIIG